jgi:hypothetical protein
MVGLPRLHAPYRTHTSNRSDLTDAQRIEYTTAVKCLMKLPPKSDRTRFPGALSRFDDFVAYHMTHAMKLHDNLHLFGAHKYYVWLFEEALRNECNYTGYQPVRPHLSPTDAGTCLLLTP